MPRAFDSRDVSLDRLSTNGMGGPIPDFGWGQFLDDKDPLLKLIEKLFQDIKDATGIDLFWLLDWSWLTNTVVELINQANGLIAWLQNPIQRPPNLLSRPGFSSPSAIVEAPDWSWDAVVSLGTLAGPDGRPRTDPQGSARTTADGSRHSMLSNSISEPSALAPGQILTCQMHALVEAGFTAANDQALRLELVPSRAGVPGAPIVLAHCGVPVDDPTDWIAAPTGSKAVFFDVDWRVPTTDTPDAIELRPVVGESAGGNVPVRFDGGRVAAAGGFLVVLADLFDAGRQYLTDLWDALTAWLPNVLDSAAWTTLKADTDAAFEAFVRKIKRALRHADAESYVPPTTSDIISDALKHNPWFGWLFTMVDDWLQQVLKISKAATDFGDACWKAITAFAASPGAAGAWATMISAINAAWNAMVDDILAAWGSPKTHADFASPASATEAALKNNPVTGWLFGAAGLGKLLTDLFNALGDYIFGGLRYDGTTRAAWSKDAGGKLEAAWRAVWAQVTGKTAASAPTPGAAGAQSIWNGLGTNFIQSALGGIWQPLGDLSGLMTDIANVFKAGWETLFGPQTPRLYTGTFTQAWSALMTRLGWTVAPTTTIGQVGSAAATTVLTGLFSTPGDTNAAKTSAINTAIANAFAELQAAANDLWIVIQGPLLVGQSAYQAALSDLQSMFNGTWTPQVITGPTGAGGGSSLPDDIYSAARPSAPAAPNFAGGMLSGRITINSGTGQSLPKWASYYYVVTSVVTVSGVDIESLPSAEQYIYVTTSTPFTLKWDASTTAGSTYNVYRGTVSGKWPTRIASKITALSYQELGAAGVSASPPSAAQVAAEVASAKAAADAAAAAAAAAQSTANTAKTNANTAQTTASQGVSDAATADSKAVAAQQAATTAQQAAATADSKAVAAAQSASAAANAASVADGKAVAAAQSAATAQGAAAAASTLAHAAQDAAGTAQSAADSAGMSASNAHDYAQLIVNQVSASVGLDNSDVSLIAQILKAIPHQNIEVPNPDNSASVQLDGSATPVASKSALVKTSPNSSEKTVTYQLTTTAPLTTVVITTAIDCSISGNTSVFLDGLNYPNYSVTYNNTTYTLAQTVIKAVPSGNHNIEVSYGVSLSTNSQCSMICMAESYTGVNTIAKIEPNSSIALPPGSILAVAVFGWQPWSAPSGDFTVNKTASVAALTSNGTNYLTSGIGTAPLSYSPYVGSMILLNPPLSPAGVGSQLIRQSGGAGTSLANYFTGVVASSHITNGLSDASFTAVYSGFYVVTAAIPGYGQLTLTVNSIPYAFCQPVANTSGSWMMGTKTVYVLKGQKVQLGLAAGSNIRAIDGLNASFDIALASRSEL